VVNNVVRDLCKYPAILQQVDGHTIQKDAGKQVPIFPFVLVNGVHEEESFLANFLTSSKLSYMVLILITIHSSSMDLIPSFDSFSNSDSSNICLLWLLEVWWNLGKQNNRQSHSRSHYVSIAHLYYTERIRDIFCCTKCLIGNFCC